MKNKKQLKRQLVEGVEELRVLRFEVRLLRREIGELRRTASGPSRVIPDVGFHKSWAEAEKAWRGRNEPGVCRFKPVSVPPDCTGMPLRERLATWAELAAALKNLPTPGTKNNHIKPGPSITDQRPGSGFGAYGTSGTKPNYRPRVPTELQNLSNPEIFMDLYLMYSLPPTTLLSPRSPLVLRATFRPMACGGRPEAFRPCSRPCRQNDQSLLCLILNEYVAASVATPTERANVVHYLTQNAQASVG